MEFKYEKRDMSPWASDYGELVRIMAGGLVPWLREGERDTVIVVIGRRGYAYAGLSDDDREFLRNFPFSLTHEVTSFEPVMCGILYMASALDGDDFDPDVYTDYWLTIVGRNQEPSDYSAVVCGHPQADVDWHPRVDFPESGEQIVADLQLSINVIGAVDRDRRARAAAAAQAAA